MKTRLLLPILLIASIGCVTERNAYKVQYDKVAKRPKQKLVPPGTVWLRDSTFMDQTEVRNLDYLEFLYWTYRLDSSNYKAMLPDTAASLTLEPFSDTYKGYEKTYARSKYFYENPAVGISYPQAIAYCEWRTARVNQFLYLRAHKEIKINDPDSMWRIVAPKYVEYRLPSKEEWEYASAAGINYYDAPLGYRSLYNKDHFPVSATAESQILFATTHFHTYGKRKYRYTVSGTPTTAVLDGTPNEYGIYNLLGNVSEMIQDTLFKGLNFNAALDGSSFRLNPDFYLLADSTYHPYDYKFTFRYSGPSPLLGFRCVCIVKQIP